MNQETETAGRENAIAHARWLIAYFTFLLLGGVAVCGSSYALDLFGVFRDARGRHLSVYFNERTAKYLLNKQYVPENFDAILVGSSLTANWDTSVIQPGGVYNESIDGGNAAEEKLLVDSALPSAHFRYALLTLSPFLTQDHQLNEGGMGKPTRREALGSINILREELDAIAVKLGMAPREFFPNGAKVLKTPVIAPGQQAFPRTVFHIDPQGLAEYNALADELRQRNVDIVWVIPPMSERLRASVEDQMQAYLASTNLVHTGEAVIDFSGPAYQAFNADAANFDDGIHLSKAAAARLSESLALEIRHLQDGSPGRFAIR